MPSRDAPCSIRSWKKWVLTAICQHYADTIVIFWLCKVLVPLFARARITNVSPHNFALGFELDEPWSTEKLTQLHIVKGMLLRDADSTVTVINVPGRYSWSLTLFSCHNTRSKLECRIAVPLSFVMLQYHTCSLCQAALYLRTNAFFCLYHTPQQHTAHRCQLLKKTKIMSLLHELNICFTLVSKSFVRQQQYLITSLNQQLMVLCPAAHCKQVLWNVAWHDSTSRHICQEIWLCFQTKW